MNVTQVSARDINVTSRGATGTLATGQLALLDGRSLYQDFFGFVMWDFLPVNFNEIKQIEVIRGPASAVWGANALNGVVNVITKSPREMQGTSAVARLRRRSTAANGGGRGLAVVRQRHARAGGQRSLGLQDFGGRLLAGSAAHARPARFRATGPRSAPARAAPIRRSRNQGTTQPKFDARVDYDYADGAQAVVLRRRRRHRRHHAHRHRPVRHHERHGDGLRQGELHASKGFRAGFFTNILNGDADNLLTGDAVTGQPIAFDFNTKTYDFEASNVQTFAAKHVVSYGGNLRFNRFDLSIAPNADNRTEFGGYVQDEIFLSNMFRWIVGARVDRFDYLDDFVFSPRTTFMIKPQREPDDPRSRTTAPTARRRSSTTSSTW